MHRCALASLTALCLSISATVPALAQVSRNFPQNALRGYAVFGQPPNLQLNGNAATLAPGARIRVESNMMAMSGALVGVHSVVNYTIDTSGLVKDIWLLTAAEIANKPWPTTAAQAQSWSFDPVAQTWTRP
jgi:hypothetical protein